MTTNFSDPPVNPLGNLEGPIPPVDPADLRNVWQMQREVQARPPGEHIGSAIELYKDACSPGANVGAVWFRASLLGILEMLGILKPWIHEGVMSDAVFKVAAVFPVKSMPVGVPQQELPFDVEEFMKQVAGS